MIFLCTSIVQRINTGLDHHPGLSPRGGSTLVYLLARLQDMWKPYPSSSSFTLKLLMSRTKWSNSIFVTSEAKWLYFFHQLFSIVYLVSANFSYFISTTGWPGSGEEEENPLSPNSSETAWNFQTPFYRMEAGSLRMVYVNFHKPICPS